VIDLFFSLYQKPEILITITGSIFVFYNFLVAWITTGGSFAGIMKEMGNYVSKAPRVSKNPPLLLGIQ
jgi:hypothetical protein